MKLPKIRGTKTKPVRVDPDELKEFSQRLRACPEWAAYADASQGELITIAVILASLYIRPEVYAITLADINHIVDEAVRNAIGGVATALGGVAQLNPDKSIRVTKPESDSITTLDAKPVQPKRTPVIH